VRRSFDIFCKVIDNYGDIGVCWRLARQLAARADSGRIRLLVDDLASFARIAPAVARDIATQTIEGVLIQHWDQALHSPEHAVAAVVIEAFACSPPAAYVERMTQRQVWINLEYLSAESWIESCHGLPSLQANGLRKFFFFPGFTAGTGGLLRETGLLTRRDMWQADPRNRLELLARLRIDAAWQERLRAGARLVYVYCYPQAPLPALMEALGASGRDTLVLLPEGIWPGETPASITTARSRVEARAHPFVDQDVFDTLLWSSDLNVVRGEDSLVRAIWAGRPMMWQPYPQQDAAHLDKLRAWLAQSPFPPGIHDAMLAWNHGDMQATASLLPALLLDPELKKWGHRTRAWCSMLARQNDLAGNLVNFCAEHGQTS